MNCIVFISMTDSDLVEKSSERDETNMCVLLNNSKSVETMLKHKRVLKMKLMTDMAVIQSTFKSMPANVS